MASKFFNKINNLKSYKKISDLKVGVRYLIKSAEFTKTKYGKSIKIFLRDEETIYLPKRYSNIKKNELEYFTNAFIIYRGKKDNYDVIEFEEPNDDLDEESYDEDSSS